jgi:hypothetical protein
VIVYLSTRAHAYTIRVYLESWGRALRGIVRPLAYEDLRGIRELPARAAYVFSDLERIPPPALAALARLRERLLAGGEALVLNDPARTMRRYELLRELRERGVNAHDVHRLDELGARPIRFPVFLRGENDHDGARTPLLRTRDALDEAARGLLEGGARPEDLLVVEFVDTRGPDGLFRKYGAQVTGERIYPRHVFFEDRRWVVKFAGRVLPRLLREERRYVMENPHEERLRELFRVARLEFGRVDYGVRADGGIEVFETNTNPSLLGPSLGAKDASRVRIHARFDDAHRAALRAIDRGGPRGEGPAVEVPPLPEVPERISLPPRRAPLRKLPRAAWRRATNRARYFLYRLLRSRG